MSIIASININLPVSNYITCVCTKCVMPAVCLWLYMSQFMFKSMLVCGEESAQEALQYASLLESVSVTAFCLLIDSSDCSCLIVVYDLNFHFHA